MYDGVIKTSSLGWCQEDTQVFDVCAMSHKVAGDGGEVGGWSDDGHDGLELETNLCEDFTITKKALSVPSPG